MKGLIFTVEGIGHDRPEGPLLVHRALEQFDGDLRLGAEVGVSFAVRKPVRWRVGLKRKRVVDLFVGPATGDRNDAIVSLAEIGQLLPPNMGGLGAILAVATLVNHEDALCMRSSMRVGAQHL